MHQVTETTIQDLIDRSIAFTHKAFVAMRTLAKFNFVDIGYTFDSDCHQAMDPLKQVIVTLYTHTEDGRRTDLLDKDGNAVVPVRVEEGPYFYEIGRRAASLYIPYFMLAFVTGFKDLLDLLEDPDDTRQMCHYISAAKSRIDLGTFPTAIRNFDAVYWQLSAQPTDTAQQYQIPELRQTPGSLHCYPRNIYAFGQTHARFRSDQPLWHVREEARIRFHLYDPLPDAVKDVLDPVKTAALFPHLSVKASNAGMIAYTQSPTAGVMDRQAVMRAGRFIRQHARDGVCDETVKQLAAHIASSLSSQFKHSREREDYKNVYINGPSSCMAYDEDGKNFGALKVDGVFVHPCEVYAHPENDLEIVWCEVQDNIVARTIINKKRMQYPRIYAKESVGNAEQRLKGYLDDLGYTQHDLALTNQKLLRISPTNYPHAIICPYIDNSNLGVDVNDDHLVTGGGENADHETGCLSDYNTNRDTWWCQCCDTNYDEDDSYEPDSHGDRVCQSCADNDHTLAYCTNSMEEAYVHEDETVYKLTDVTRGTLRYYTYIYFNSSYRDMDHYGLVELSTSYYDSNCVALEEDCCRTEDGDYVLLSDLEEHDLFFNQYTSEACEVSDWVVCVDADGNPELTRISDIDEDLFVHAMDETDDTYPMLKVYTAIIQDEEAA